MKVNEVVCIKCKGYKKLCGLSSCPLLERYRIHLNAIKNVKRMEVEGSTPPSLIVGEHNYPKVNVLLQVPPNVKGNRAKIFDSPSTWWGKLSLEEIIKLRSSLIALSMKADVNNPWKLYDKEISLSAISSKPVDLEARLRKRPKPILSFDSILTPIGPKALPEKLTITSNPKIERVVEKVIWDDMKAYEAVWELFQYNVDFYTIVRCLSLGLLGRIRSRRLVPTRWAITAVDTIISSRILKILKSFKQVNEHYVGVIEYLGNRFGIILYPSSHELLWIEIWHPSSLWVRKSQKPIIVVNKERANGKPKYIDGGYMAAKTGILQCLLKTKRQAGIIVFREVLPSYYAPVGNWHIRMSSKKALELKLRKVESLNEAFAEVGKYLMVSMDELLNAIPYLNIKAQKKLTKYMKLDEESGLNR